ncbi:MAG: DNA polymerase/3'-5' exonuclease PolX [Chloroflexi bacterium]|nr:DNA polymerase/3'-5' exonuclease PolX [Chloroflexota bacterium]
MPLTNREIAAMFENIADMLQIQGESIHRVSAYRNAAQAIRDLPRDVQAIADDGELETIPNVGKIIAEKLTELLTTGKLEFYERLSEEVPPGVVEILHLNGVGPKKAKMFWQDAGITSVDELEKQARAGKLRELSGMGVKSEAKILTAIESLKQHSAETRTPLGIALPSAEAILAQLLALPQAEHGVIAGSIRRARPTIGDVDLLVASDDAPPIMDRFVTMPEVEQVLGHGPTKSSVVLHNGLQADLRVLAAERWGTALQYFSGSQTHNIRIREMARAQGLSLNEHAFTPINGDGAEILCATEEAVYERLGLPWIPPELREDGGEIEAAQAGHLPNLITLEDIRSDLHMHTTWSDGKLSIRQMADAARARGRQFIVITDHSVSSAIANGLSAERLLEQQEEVRRIDAEMEPDFRVFHGVEMDIRADGTLDYPDEVLAQLDFVIASLHVSLQQPREQVTARVLNAIRNPYVDLIGHPRGQLILQRDPADLDMDAVIAAAAEHETALEINANPRRLDLEAQYARRAVEMGVRLAINTDAHTEEQLDQIRYGIMTARRAWVEPQSVINTLTLDEFIEWTQRRIRQGA